jgi:hypothetical protein
VAKQLCGWSDNVLFWRIFGVSIAVAAFVMQRLLRPETLILLIVPVTIALVALRWWALRLGILRRKHGLLCANCGRFITKTGWKKVLSTFSCEHCNSPL